MSMLIKALASGVLSEFTCEKQGKNMVWTFIRRLSDGTKISTSRHISFFMLLYQADITAYIDRMINEEISNIKQMEQKNIEKSEV